MIATPADFDTANKPVRVLHLEDSAADHELARLALRRAPVAHELTQVDTLAALMQALRGGQFDLVLADYRLRGFTAIDAWQQAQTLAAHPPFVLLSGAIGEAAAVNALHLGFADYLLKDDMARLPHVIARAIEMAEARCAREQAAAELAASERRLAELAEHLQATIEEERAAIAREIHDDVGGALTAARFDLAWIARHAGGDAAMAEHAHSANEMLQHALGASQRIMMNLRPPVLDQGLVAAVRWLAQTFERRTGMRCAVLAPQQPLSIAQALQLVAYRTVQEALTNVQKYAQARQVRVELSEHEGLMLLEVCDDGMGVAPGALGKSHSFGLRGLRERARRAGGWLDVSSQQGRGTCVVLTLPVAGGADTGQSPP
ncbi:hybrid sensor histidine kinase/response regulator [Comamonas flocculans]|uniref:Sensor histidine kinase n=1 Tax=Comamonas flocculans TaxID=2597701 RepID=A0A5B8RXK8_9BURK|nr:sensor histidine kinase [Comamonas flocculans]QEA12557.1 sensor histidine kinase [Comamonas flocculans]